MFKYKLIGDNDYVFDIVGTISANRGVDDLTEYLHLDKSVTTHWSVYKNIKESVELIAKHLKNNSNIHIVVDQDADGYTSAAIIFQYLKLHNEDINITYHIHDKKVHGINGVEIPSNIDLLIIPDASTNEIEEHKRVKEQNKNIDIIILDHHSIESDKYNNDYAIVVNPQQDKCGNLNLSGAGIVYKTCEALDDYFQTDYADYFLDLVAVGNIADVMSLKDKEVRYYVNEGLNNINNEFIMALIDKQSYSMKGKINPTTVGFYIAPLINSVTRIGSLEERIDMFKAFIGHKELVKYKPRGESETLVPFVVDMARRCSNIKERQNRNKEKSVEKIIKNLQVNDDDKVVIIKETEIDEGTSGLIAMNIASKFNKPTIVLGTEKDGLIKGSARSCNSFDGFKDIVQKSKLFQLAEGHNSAFGVEIKEENVNLAIDKLNELLKDETFETVYTVDFVLPFNSVNKDFLKEIIYLENVWGRDLNEPLFVIKDIKTEDIIIDIFGKKEDTVGFNHNNIKYIAFKQNDETINDLLDSKSFDIVGKASINEYNGEKTYQVIIQDFNIRME